MSKRDLPSIRSINTDFINLFCIFSKIFDVPEYMASAILTNEIA